MPKITFIGFGGKERHAEGADGDSLLDIALANHVEGITGECGGCLSCATCHVYIDDAWLSKIGPPSADEDMMLDGAYCDREPNSRLGCQIKLSGELGGIIIKLPERQT